MNLHSTLDTRFLSPFDVARLVMTHGLARSLSEMADAIEADFRRWGDFDKSARTASYSAIGAIELMPIADAARYAFKYVNGHPQNVALGLPTVMAFGALADVATGQPRLVSELTLTTALRTAATSAMAARALARPGVKSMALVGNGAQSEFQAMAFHRLCDVEEVRLYDVDPRATSKLVRNLAASPDARGLRVVVCASVAGAVRGADVVTTITADKTRAAILTADMIEPGMHLNAVGGDCPGKTEIPPAVMRLARVFVEYEPQTRVEGDLQQMPADFAVVPLWEVLTGRAPGRLSSDQVTMFDSVGFALEDFSALRWLRALAEARGVGRALPLVPALADPKDLFSLLRAVPADGVSRESIDRTTRHAFAHASVAA